MIRQAEHSDAKALHDYLKEILKYHKGMYPQRFQGESKYTLEEVEGIIEDEKYIIYVYEDNGVKAYIIMKDYGAVLYVDDLYVDVSLRGKHIGKQLMDVVNEVAATRGFSEIQLNVWQKNEAAIAFYEALGYEPLRTIYTKEIEKR